jgi:hypothetical protein
VLALGLIPVFWLLLVIVLWTLGGGDAPPPGAG